MGNYTLGEMIGKGGMGTVYRAHHEGLDIDVAVKFIHEHLAHDDEIVERFLREARLAAKIKHPNVVQVYDTGRDETGRPYIVMELLDGESLRQMLKRGPISEHEAVQIVRQVLQGLEEAHEQGVAHRDIKPGNIFITARGRAKIVDFGIAKGLGSSRLTGTGTQIGTPEYMSPEQAEGKPADGRTDLYSLGIVLYEMLTGSVPFSADSGIAVLRMQLDTPPPPLPEATSEWVRAVAERALAKSPSDRFASARAMVEALTLPDQVSGKGVRARAGRRSSETRPSVRSEKAPATVPDAGRKADALEVIGRGIAIGGKSIVDQAIARKRAIAWCWVFLLVVIFLAVLERGIGWDAWRLTTEEAPWGKNLILAGLATILLTLFAALRYRQWRWNATILLVCATAAMASGLGLLNMVDLYAVVLQGDLVVLRRQRGLFPGGPSAVRVPFSAVVDGHDGELHAALGAGLRTRSLQEAEWLVLLLVQPDLRQVQLETDLPDDFDWRSAHALQAPSWVPSDWVFLYRDRPVAFEVSFGSLNMFGGGGWYIQDGRKCDSEGHYDVLRQTASLDVKTRWEGGGNPKRVSITIRSWIRRLEPSHASMRMWWSSSDAHKNDRFLRPAPNPRADTPGFETTVD